MGGESWVQAHAACGHLVETASHHPHVDQVGYPIEAFVARDQWCVQVHGSCGNHRIGQLELECSFDPSGLIPYGPPDVLRAYCSKRAIATGTPVSVNLGQARNSIPVMIEMKTSWRSNTDAMFRSPPARSMRTLVSTTTRAPPSPVGSPLIAQAALDGQAISGELR